MTYARDATLIELPAASEGPLDPYWEIVKREAEDAWESVKRRLEGDVEPIVRPYAEPYIRREVGQNVVPLAIGGAILLYLILKR